MCGVDFDGVAIGTFARKLVKDYITSDEMFGDDQRIKEAVNIAYKLIKDNIGESIW
ncbi:MAG: hypothetical protein KKD07_09870 [Candidatus Omnitrophica bacterium]|nr:hypothetical protein [Candidatus Omnitrophota bacterium]MBU1997698.1 hypothetical protein [Candidatus Omnitrophota bacterium]MBU4334734.1 hypothetical protein [Candidatus Omnitrophota bacterium]